MQDHTTILSKTNPETSLNSPQEVNKPQLSYFDTITQRLDQWEAKQQTIQAKRTQLTKTTIIKEIDSVTGITKIYRLSSELISTEQADVLGLHEQEPEMEGSCYVS